MSNLKKLYDKNINIMQYLRDKTNSKENNSAAILTSYDMQAGSYVKNFEENKTASLAIILTRWVRSIAHS